MASKRRAVLMPENRMKNIAILTAGSGEGHNTAARNLCSALSTTPGVKAQVVDVLELTYGRLNDLVRRAYLSTINHAPGVWERVYGMIDSGPGIDDYLPLLAPVGQTVRRLLEEERPDAVVSTYPLYNYFLDPLRKEGHRFAQVTVVTDSITVNSIWYRCGSDLFVVPNEETATVLTEKGVPAERVRTLGFPVSSRFTVGAGAKAGPGPGEPWRLLYVINSGRQEAPGIVRALLALEGVALEVAVGRDAELRAEVEAAVAEAGRPATLHGWSDQMPELMMQAHFLISKAGGATVQEALAARTPMVITQVVPGQEEGNARLLIENQCGCLATGAKEIAAAVGNAVANGGAQWHQWQQNLQRLSRPDAARDVAQAVLSLTS